MVNFGTLTAMVMLLYSLGPAGATFYPRQPFIDPACQNGDCSWKFGSPDGIQDQACSIMDFLDTGALDGYCPNPFPTNLLPGDRPPSVKKNDIILEEYSKYFSEDVTGNPDTAGSYTCLRIKYKLDQYTAEKLKGIQFMLRGMSQGDLNKYFCQNHNHGVNTTHYYALEAYPSKVRREFSYDCFCGIRPGFTYNVTIRTLPVDYDDANTHETARFWSYPADCVNPSNCNTNREDKRCEWNEQGKWYPKCREQKQILSGDYKTIQISFALAPPELNFDRYKVLLYRNGTYTGVGVLLDMGALQNAIIHTGPTCTSKSNQTLTTTLTLKDHFVKNCSYKIAVQAYPSLASYYCRDADGDVPQGGCVAYMSQPFHVIGNPCDSAPCSDHGDCESQQERYTCDCHNGYMFMNNTCVVDPCSDDPCGLNGNCSVYQTQSSAVVVGTNPYSYTCTCIKGYILSPDGNTCIVDPCYVNPCNEHGACAKVSNVLKPLMWGHRCDCNKGYLHVDHTCKANPCILNQTTPTVSPCGSFGECTLTSSNKAYNCTCWDGYKEGINADSKKTCMLINSATNIVIAITIGSLGGLAILMFLGLFVMKSSNERMKKIRDKLSFCREFKPDKVMPIKDRGLAPVGDKSRHLIDSTPRVFILYSDDHEHHTDAIIKLATFLQNVCNCKIRLDMWCKTEIGDKKTWLYNEIHNADKVLVIFSKGTLHKMHAAMAQKPIDTGGGGAVGELGDMFWPGYRFATDEFDKDPNLLISKYVVAYFEYSQKEDILPEVTNVALKYKIPENLEGLFFRLHNIPPCTPTSRRRAPDLVPGSYASTSQEGHALCNAIEKMKTTKENNPDWYEKPNHIESMIQNATPNFHLLHGAEADKGKVLQERLTSFFQGIERYQDQSDICSVAFTDDFDQLQQELYSDDTRYETSHDYSRADGTFPRNDDQFSPHLRKDNRYGLNGNMPMQHHEFDDSQYEAGSKDNHTRRSPDSDNDSALSDGHHDRLEQEPFLLKTVDPRDVDIHPNPPFTDEFDNLRREQVFYPSADTRYESAQDYERPDGSHHHQRDDNQHRLNNPHLRNDSQYGISGNPSMPFDESNYELAFESNVTRGLLSSDNGSIPSSGDSHHDKLDQQPFVLKTLDPQDVQIHPNPPFDRMDSGIGYMSDIHIHSLSEPQNDMIVNTPV